MNSDIRRGQEGLAVSRIPEADDKRFLAPSEVAAAGKQAQKAKNNRGKPNPISSFHGVRH